MMRVSEDRKLFFWSDRTTGLSSWIVVDVEKETARMVKAQAQPDGDFVLGVPSDVDGGAFDMRTIRRLTLCYAIAKKTSDIDGVANAATQMRDTVTKSKRLREMSLKEFQATTWEGFKSQFETACRQWNIENFVEQVIVICDKLLWSQGVVVDVEEFVNHYQQIWNIHREDRDRKPTAQDMAIMVEEEATGVWPC